MRFDIITIFPNIFDSYFNESIIKRAQNKNLIDIKIHNLRDWTDDKHKSVDDTPYGGGAGMVMKVEPIYKAVSSIKYLVSGIKNNNQNTKYKIPNTKTILLSAKGKTWNQQLAKKYSKLDNIILICGRYEGVDERVTKFIDEEISIGDYVLTGGELPAMTMIDSITRLLPGVLGNKESLTDESFSKQIINHKPTRSCLAEAGGSKIINYLEYPQYTRPEIFVTNPFLKGARGFGEIKNYKVPKVLLSGNHKKIKEWRQKKMKIL